MRASLLSMVMALGAMQAFPPAVQRGQAPAGPAAQPAQAASLGAQCQCSIEVTVKRQGNGEPISGVDVTVTDSPNVLLSNFAAAGRGLVVAAPSPGAGNGPVIFHAATDSAGHAAFRNLAEGSYTIQIQREGYFYIQNDNFQPQATTSVAVGPVGNSSALAVAGAVVQNGARRQPIQQVAFNLVPGGTISGRLQDANQRPVSGIQVAAFRVGYQFGRRMLSQIGTAVQTDDRGEYRLFWFPPGDYFIRTVANALVRTQAYPTPTYYPGTLDSKLAKWIAIREGEEFSGGDFTLQAAAGVTISGTIANTIPGGRVGPNGQVNRTVASLFLVPRNAAFVELPPIIPNIFPARRGGTSTDETIFEIRGVPPGTYDFYPIYTDGSGVGSYYTGRTPIEVASENITAAKSVIRPGVELNGHLTITGTPPVSTRPQPNGTPNIRIQMIEKDNMPNLVAQRNGIIPDANGLFSMKNSTEGHYFIASVQGLPADAYVSEIRQGARSIFDDGVVSVGSDSADPLEVVVTRGGGTIQGTVEDGKHNPVSSIRVALIPDFPRRGNLLLYKSATSNASGIFNMSGIAPGAYKLYAWEHIPYGAEQNTEFMRDYDALGATLTVTPGLAMANIHVPLISK